MSAGGRVTTWCLRSVFLLLLIASPWPFGSATYRPMGLLTGALFILLGVWVVYLLLSKKNPRPAWVASRWILLGLGIGLLQLLPVPTSLLKMVAPASHAVHVPVVQEAKQILGEAWRPLSIEPFSTEAELLRFASLAAAFFLAGHLFNRRSEIRLFVYAVTAVGVALSFFAVYQQARWGTTLYGRFPVASATPFGPFVNHNHFAGYVEMCTLVALGATIGYIERRTPTPAILFGGSATIMGIALVLSRSRGGLIATAAGVVLLGFVVLQSKARARAGALAIWAGIISTIIFLAAPQIVFNRLGTMVRPDEDISIQFRLKLWSDSFRLFTRSPVLGTGVGTYGAAIPPYRTGTDETRAEHAESDLVEHACETGLAGLVVLAGFVVAVAGRARKKLEGKDIGRSYGILMGITAACFALLVHSIFDFNTRIPSNGLLLATLLGIVASAHPRTAPSPSFVKGYRFYWAFAVLALTAGIGWRSVSIGQSRQITWEIDPILAEPEEFARVAGRLTEAARFASSNPEVSFKRGLLYNEEAYRSADAARYRDLRFEQARASFEEAVRLAPARGRHWFELAWTEGNLRHDRLADPLFLYALELEPTWSQLRANHALYLASRGLVKQAVEQLQIGRSLLPGIDAEDAVRVIGPYGNDDLDILLRAAGDDAEARKVIQKYLTER